MCGSLNMFLDNLIYKRYFLKKLIVKVTTPIYLKDNEPKFKSQKNNEFLNIFWGGGFNHTQ